MATVSYRGRKHNKYHLVLPSRCGLNAWFFLSTAIGIFLVVESLISPVDADYLPTKKTLAENKTCREPMYEYIYIFSVHMFSIFKSIF